MKVLKSGAAASFTGVWLLWAAGCGPVEPECAVDGECAAEEACVDGACRPRAMPDAGPSPCSPGEVCRPAAGACDVEEVCPASGFCPPDAREPFDTLCRAAAGPCDRAETCNGDDATCPEDELEPDWALCGPISCSDGWQSPVRFCSGVGPECPEAEPVSCQGYQCVGAGCGTNCVTHLSCLSTHYCVANACVPRLADGEACTEADECLSASCTGFYADADGDGFGAGAAALFCGTAAPAGYASKAGDCCDSDDRAFPGQPSHQPTQRIGCGGYDFDCDGTVTLQWTAANACQSTGGCGTLDLDCDGTTGWATSTVPACGQSATFTTSCTSLSACNPATCPTCQTCGAASVARTQACR